MPSLRKSRGRFTVADVAEGIHDKLVRRHPHVFGNVVAEDSEEVLSKLGTRSNASKRGRASVFDGIPRSLPSLSYAAKVGHKASKLGFDWPDVSGALPKVTEETAELIEAIDAGDSDETTAELGDLLFAVG